MPVPETVRPRTQKHLSSPPRQAAPAAVRVHILPKTRPPAIPQAGERKQGKTIFPLSEGTAVEWCRTLLGPLFGNLVLLGLGAKLFCDGALELRIFSEIIRRTMLPATPVCPSSTRLPNSGPKSVRHHSTAVPSGIFLPRKVKSRESTAKTSPHTPASSQQPRPPAFAISPGRSYGIPYLYPFCSSSVNDDTDWEDSILRLPLSKMKRRPIFAKPDGRARKGGGA